MDYKTVNSYARVEYTEKKSRFIGSIATVKTLAEAESFITGISREFKDATHNVYAYVVRDGMLKRCSDNGEPQGTAGVPTLDVLQKENITDVCCVVTRYFGGTLLGGGGLVRAYSHTAKLAVDEAKIVTMTLCREFSIECEYTVYGKLSYILPNYEVAVTSSDFAEVVRLCLRIDERGYDSFVKELTEMSNGKIVPYSIFDSYNNIG